MREIKFRAWERSRNTMIHNAIEYELLHLAKPTHSTDDKFNNIGFSPQEIEYFEIMQFTGLSDKNGKEIYEGDLVKFKGSVFSVVYRKNEFICIDKKDTHYIYPYYEAIELIGNIYENPSLLTPKQITNENTTL